MKNDQTRTQGKPFGTLSDGSDITRYTLSNNNGASIAILDLGAIIHALVMPSNDGQTDVVLGFDTVEDYINAHSLPAPPYFGALVGRYCGRISKGKFAIDGKEFQLNINNNSNTLHGGVKGFDQKLWHVKNLERNSITLHYTSPDGEEHFPGELQLDVTYSITDENEIVIQYDAVSSEDTIVNFTQHSYFNLDGHKADLSGQQVTVNSGTILEIEPDNIPTGKLINAGDKFFDFRRASAIPNHIDDSFVIQDPSQPVAILESAQNGLRMTVSSNQPSLHIYVGGDCFGKIKGKDGADYKPYNGICFESQHYTDAPNHPDFPSAILRKGDQYHQKTIWKFDRI